MPLFVVLFYLLPDPTHLMKYPLGRSVLGDYYHWHYRTRDRVIDWHKDELSRIDFEFRFRDARLRLVALRIEARERGISPGSPEYPSIRDLLPPSDFARASSEGWE